MAAQHGCAARLHCTVAQLHSSAAAGAELRFPRQVLQNDVQSHARSVQSVSDAGQGLLQCSAGDGAEGLQRSLQELQRRWDTVCMESERRQLELQRSLGRVQDVTAELTELLQCLESVEMQLCCCRLQSGDPKEELNAHLVSEGLRWGSAEGKNPYENATPPVAVLHSGLVAALLHCCVAALLRCCVAALLHCCIQALLRCCVAALLRCCIAALLRCCVAALLRCCIAALLRCCIAVLLPCRSCAGRWIRSWLCTAAFGRGCRSCRAAAPQGRTAALSINCGCWSRSGRA